MMGPSLDNLKHRNEPPNWVTGTITHDGVITGTAEVNATPHGWRMHGACWRWNIRHNDWAEVTGNSRLTEEESQAVKWWLEERGWAKPIAQEELDK